MNTARQHGGAVRFAIPPLPERRPWPPGYGPTSGVALDVRPPLYYLNIYASNGVYTNLNATPSERGLPLANTSIVTTPIQTDIRGSPDLLWNVSLVYSFDLID